MVMRNYLTYCIKQYFKEFVPEIINPIPAGFTFLLFISCL